MICIYITYLADLNNSVFTNTNDANIHINAPLSNRGYEQQPVPVLWHFGEHGQAPVLFYRLPPAPKASAQYAHDPSHSDPGSSLFSRVGQPSYVSGD